MKIKKINFVNKLSCSENQANSVKIMHPHTKMMTFLGSKRSGVVCLLKKSSVF